MVIFSWSLILLHFEIIIFYLFQEKVIKTRSYQSGDWNKVNNTITISTDIKKRQDKYIFYELSSLILIHANA